MTEKKLLVTHGTVPSLRLWCLDILAGMFILIIMAIGIKVMSAGFFYTIQNLFEKTEFILICISGILLASITDIVRRFARTQVQAGILAWAAITGLTSFMMLLQQALADGVAYNIVAYLSLSLGIGIFIIAYMPITRAIKSKYIVPGN